MCHMVFDATLLVDTQDPRRSFLQENGKLQPSRPKKGDFPPLAGGVSSTYAFLGSREQDVFKCVGQLGSQYWETVEDRFRLF